MAIDKNKIKKIIGITAIASGATFVGLSVLAKKKKASSVYDDDPEQKNPFEGRKVHLVEDENDKENADGVKGHLVDLGPSEHQPSFYEKYVKRGIDVVLSFGGLIVLSPLMGAIALAIKIEDPGPVLFTQKRVGQNKQYFKLHKFRSMKMCTPHDVPTHMLDNPDQYITKVGKFIRAHSLDELPQIWDIFIGNLSTVGPRPALWSQDLLTSERDRYGANDIKPGLTGWAQINGRDELEIPEKARLDGEYCKNLGLKMDAKVFMGSLHVFGKDESVVEGGTGEMKKTQSDDSTGEKKKILVICQYYKPEPFRISDICEEMVRRGHEVQVVTGYPNYPEGILYEGYGKGRHIDEVINGVKVHRCYTIPRETGTAKRMLNYYSYAASSTQYVLSKDCVASNGKPFDVVFCNQLSPVMMADAAIAYKKKYKVPAVMYCLDLWPESLIAGGITRESPIYKYYHHEQKLITYPRTDSQFLTDDMGETAVNVINVIRSKYGFDNPFGDTTASDEDKIRQILNSKKVSDHHAIIPTMEIKEQDPHQLKKDEEMILYLVSMRLLEATADPYVYTETEVTVECQDELFTAKGKVVKHLGWKEYEELTRDFGGSKSEKEKDTALPIVTEGQTFSHVKAEKTEHFTTPPKQYSEDTLLSAMETAGNKEFDQDTEKKGLGTPATRANIIEKLVNSRYAVRKGKQIIPTDDGKALIEILPDFLKSASMTAEWENQLLQIEKGQLDPDLFMSGIQNMLTMMLNGCDQIDEEEMCRFQQRESIGVCPVCGSLVYEGKKNFYCSDKKCNFVLWKENHYLERMKKKIDAPLAAELLKGGKARVQDFYSVKKDCYFEADLCMEYKDGRVNFSLEFPKDKPSANRKKRR